jgi:hypothetical protein
MLYFEVIFILLITGITLYHENIAAEVSLNKNQNGYIYNLS